MVMQNSPAQTASLTADHVTVSRHIPEGTSRSLHLDICTYPPDPVNARAYPEFLSLLGVIRVQTSFCKCEVLGRQKFLLLFYDTIQNLDKTASSSWDSQQLVMSLHQWQVIVPSKSVLGSGTWEEQKWQLSHPFQDRAVPDPPRQDAEAVRCTNPLVGVGLALYSPRSLC